MNNSNLPAYPQANDEIAKAFMEVEEVAPNGLTKREAFALAAMQGLLSEGLTMDNLVASNAVKLADDLLKELAK